MSIQKIESGSKPRIEVSVLEVSGKDDFTYSVPRMTVEFKAPVFVFHEATKQITDFEMDVLSPEPDEDPEYLFPIWSKGSAEQIDAIDSAYANLLFVADAVFDEMIALGVPEERARAVLPQTVFTRWCWTGTVPQFAEFFSVVLDNKHSKEMNTLITLLDVAIKDTFPETWAMSV